jgi:hypothetical protein
MSVTFLGVGTYCRGRVRVFVFADVAFSFTNNPTTREQNKLDLLESLFLESKL